jgi:3-oxoacyl-[acyl-carrier protein] reductase
MPPALLIEKKDSDFKRIINVHLMGTFYCMREAAAYMVRRKFGRIINISSRAGVFGLYGKSDYSAAKAGIIGLTFAGAKELYKKGITVNVIAPAAIRTPLSIKNIAKQKKRRARLDMVVGEPSDVANLVSFLSKDESYLINGLLFLLDAGGHLWHGMDDVFSQMIKRHS